MKTLFIAPSIRQSASVEFPDGIPRSISKNFGIYPWLGLGYLSGYLKQHGFESEIIDIDAENLDIPQVIRRILEIKPQLIGISTISFTFLYALRLAREIKKHYNCPVIMGGPHISVYPREVMVNEVIDVGVIGEGEITFLELVKVFSQTRTKPEALSAELAKINGIVFRAGGGTIITPARKLIENIDELPFPAMEKIKVHQYFGCNHVKPYITMVTARGCPFNCSFCSKQHWGESFRFHSAERVVAEVEHYVKDLGIRAIDFYDDTFTMPRSRIIKVLELIKQKNIKFDFGLMTRVDCVDPELLSLLKEGGCKVIAYGVEFGSSRIQQEVNKVLLAEKVKNAFQSAEKAGIRTVGFFMIGHPEETEEDIQQTISLIRQIKADYVKTNILIPYPGSRLYRQLLDSGHLEVDFWAELTKGNTPPLSALIRNKVSMPRLVSLRNYMNRISYRNTGMGNLAKLRKIKSFQDIKRTLAIFFGSYFDRQI
jgi:anaerobic magnesium-protoporphyrin IX monomethyl ester cyclase